MRRNTLPIARLLLITLSCVVAAILYYAVSKSRKLTTPKREGRIGADASNPARITTEQPSAVMNEKYKVIFEEYKKISDKTSDIFTVILAKMPKGITWSNFDEKEKTEPYISHAEWSFINLLSFFGGCENHGTLHRETHEGYALRDAMIEVGINDCAEVFRLLKPLQVKEDELEGDPDTDEFWDRADVIEEEMKKIEREMPSEPYEEICVLLWRYAQKHGLDKMLAEELPGTKEGDSSK